MKNNVLNYFEETVKQYPNKIAVQDKNKSISFIELSNISKKIANIIISNNISLNKPIAVFLPKSVEAVMSFIGILYSSNYYVPLDIESPENRVKLIINNVSPSLLITSSDKIDLLKKINFPLTNIIFIDKIDLQDNKIEIDNINKKLDKIIDTDPIYIMYTSGSSGIPKGVVISHRGVIDYITWAIECFKISDKEIIGNQAPFFFDNSTLDIYLCLFTGATLFIINKEAFVLQKTAIELIIKYNINFIFWVPSVLINIANHHLLNSLKPTCLKKILFAGEIMPNKQLNYWRKNIPDALYANLYGPTEITVDCTYYIVNRDFQDEDPLPIGYACKNSDIIILNEQNDPVKVNEIGELCVRGSSLALGYYNDHEETNKVFVQNPLNIHYRDIIYRTGDLVYINNNNEIIFIGRKDFQIKHLGYRIELNEIERVVYNIKEIFNVCGVYDKSKNEIVMFYQANKKIETHYFMEILSKYIPKYMIPHKYILIENFPLNENGKVNRNELLDLL